MTPPSPRFFEVMSTTFGQTNTLMMKKLSNAFRSLTSVESQLKFLMQCRSLGIHPPFLIQKMKIFDTFYNQSDSQQHNIERIATTLLDNLLRLEINICNDNIRKHNRTISGLTELLSTNIPENVLNDFVEHQLDFKRRKKVDMTNNHIHKIQKSYNLSQVFYHNSQLIGV